MTRPLTVGLGVVLLALLQTSLLPGVTAQAVKPKEDLCAHSFHSFLCNPTKNAKRRLYDGRKTGDNSNRHETVIKPEEPNLEGDNSNDDLSFQGPGYLPPVNEKRGPNLVNDGSANDPDYLKPISTTTTRRPTTTTTTTRRPTTTTTTTRRPTTTTTTTRRPTTTTTTTTRRPTTTTTTTTRRPTTRSLEYLPPPRKEPNLIGGDSLLDPTRVLLPTTTQRVETTPAKAKTEDLCAHSFHSFLCDSNKPKKQRRIYNGQRTAPGDTNVLGENSFQQPSRLLPPTTPKPRPPTSTTTTTPRPRPPPTTTTYKPRPPPTTTTYKPRPPPTTTTYKPRPPPTTRATTQRPQPNRNLIPDNTYLSPAYLPPKPTTTTPDPDVAPDAAQNPSVRIKADNEVDLCKHSFHSFLCDSSKSKKQRRVYNGQRTVPDSNLLGANSFNRDSAVLLPPVKAPAPRTDRPKPTPPPKQPPYLVPDNSFVAPSYVKPAPRPTPPPTPRPTPPPTPRPTPPPTPEVFPDAASNADVRTKPDADLCSHSFHSFQCAGQKTGGRRRVHDGQHANIVGANSFREAKRLRAPSRFEALDTAASTYQRPAPRSYEFASSNVDEAHVAAPSTSKPIPASLARLNPPTTTQKPSEEVEPAAAAQAPAVIAQPEHHHEAHHHDDHHHDDHHHGDHAHAAATGHEHGHDHHGDHHHHHHNITLEQLCRDPFHAFLCLNVDSSKRRIYDGNPVEDSPSARERQQLLGSTSIRESRKVAAPSAVKTVNDAPKPVPLSYLQQRSQFPSASTPLTFDVTTYVREVSTTPQPQTTTTTTLAPPPRVVQTKYINPELSSRPQPTTFVEESPEVETPRPAPRQRRPELRAPTPTQGTFPGERVRRPLRRRPRPDADVERHDVSFRPAPESVPEFINRRSDDAQQIQEAPRRVRFGEKVPRRKRLPVPDADVADKQLSPGEFVRGPRGAVRDLAAIMEEVDPETRCKEPFQAFQCGHKVKREAKEDEKRTGNMRGAPQGQEAEAGAEEVKERVTEKTKRVKFNKRVEQRVKAEVAEVSEEAEVAEVEKGVETTTEDQYVAYQRGIEEEKKRREEEEENRKEELKRRESELKNRKDELKRREKEQERRKVEDRKRKEDLLKKKIEEAERKEALKKLENEERLEDAKEDRDDKDEDEEDDKEDAEKDELLSDYDKAIKAEEKRRAEEAKRREEELVRREEELKRREVEEKRRLAEAERRKVHDKLVEEELERRKVEKVRVAEELERRKQEDDRRTAAKEKAEAQAKAQAEAE